MKSLEARQSQRNKARTDAGLDPVPYAAVNVVGKANAIAGTGGKAKKSKEGDTVTDEGDKPASGNGGNPDAWKPGA